MLWLMNTFNKSSSYLIQVLTVTPSVLPSSIYCIQCMVYINLKMAEKTVFRAQKKGRGQNYGTLRAPFCSLNPTKSKILDPPLCTHTHTCPVLLNHYPKRVTCSPKGETRSVTSPEHLQAFFFHPSKHLCWALSLSLQKVLSHTEQTTLLVAPVFLASSNCCYSLVAALHLLLQSTLFWAAPYQSLSLIPKCFKSFRTTSLHLLLRPPLGLVLRSQTKRHILGKQSFDILAKWPSHSMRLLIMMVSIVHVSITPVLSHLSR